MAHLFSTLDEHGVVVDLISTSEVHVSIAVGNINPQTLEKVIANLSKGGRVDVKSNMAILSLVGKGMYHTVGTSGLFFTTLAKHGINIEMISQGGLFRTKYRNI